MDTFRRAADRAARVLLVGVGLGAGWSIAAPRPASAQVNQCNVVDVDFVVAESPNERALRFDVQMVAWLETPDGTFVDTVFITQQAGTFGLGNRPGRFDFNSGPKWPYGSRTTLFPVWAHRHGLSFPQVVFQNSDESGLSHPFNQSSREMHFCRPLMRTESAWDAASCASAVFTDKGVLSPTATSLYPPRADVVRATPDNPSVDMYNTLNPFDAISQASPKAETPTTISWPIPTELPGGDYVLFVEVSREFDMNTSFNDIVFPGPVGIPYGEYGLPYRGQPSVIYKLPFVIGGAENTATTVDYIGFGDPTGEDGNIRPPDASKITAGVDGSGAGRLRVTNDGDRVRIVSRSEEDFTAPDVPSGAAVEAVTGGTATIGFLAPGDDGQLGKIKGYEVRYRVGEDITADNFDSSIPVTASVQISDPGTPTTVTLTGLLPETDYTVAIRAFDDCRNTSGLSKVQFSTAQRQIGEVDACFVATAAYGSVMANDVEMLRRFRDALLEKTALGELAVEAYYTFGPAVAGLVGESELLRATARKALEPVVGRVRAARF